MKVWHKHFYWRVEMELGTYVKGFKVFFLIQIIFFRFVVSVSLDLEFYQ